MRQTYRHIIFGLILLLFGCMDLKELDKVVLDDFKKRYPDFTYISHRIGEGDLAVVYVHVRYEKPGLDSIFNEEWQYWNLKSGWLHRDDYLKLKDMTNSSFDIDKILGLSDSTEIIIAIDDYLNEKSDYCENIEILNDHQKTFIIIENLEREINNGGFNQFYLNSSGDFSHETIDALIKIGANKTAEIVKKANAQFPDNTVPKNRNERQLILEQIEDKADEIWETCDNDFYKYEDDLAGLLIDFVKNNKTDFKK